MIIIYIFRNITFLNENCAFKGLVGKTERMENLENRGIEGRILLKCMSKKKDESVMTGFIWFRIGKVVGCCEHGSETFGSVKCRNY